MKIFISGKAGSGKDTFGVMLAHVLQGLISPTTTNYVPNFNNFKNIIELMDNRKDVKSIFRNIYFTSFAEPLKKCVAGLLDCDYSLLNDNEFKRLNTPYKVNDNSLTVRELIIYFGDIIRKDNPYYFAESLLRRVCDRFVNNKQTIAIITDLRFKNEYKYVKTSSDVIFIRINRNLDNNNECFRKHISETDLDNNINFDYTIDNNGSLESLYEEATTIAYNCIDHINNKYEK